MQENLYVIATRGKNNTEVYLKISEKETKSGRCLMEWTEDINEAYATFYAFEVEDFAKSYFKNFNKWYVKKWRATFN